MEIILTIVGLLLTLIFGVLTFVIKEKKFKLNDDDGLYYYEDRPKNPYCPKCYVNKRKKILIDKDTRICPKCKACFQRNPYIYVAHSNSQPRFKIL